MSARFLGVGFIALSIATAAAAGPDTSTKGLVKAAATYVAAYQAKMAYVIADEEYVQRVYDEKGTVRQERLMNGELVLTFVPADRTWLAIHDVIAVDGELVRDRANVRELLQRGAFESITRQLLARNAQFNIGSVERNFNEPTLALLVFEAKRVGDFSFDRKSLAQDSGATLATLAFEEKDDASTVIHDMHGAAVPIKGEIEMDAATGEIRRSLVSFKINAVKGELRTVYSKSDKLDLWVPQTFTEEYVKSARSDYERIECEAKYSNYQQFGAKMRIK